MFSNFSIYYVTSFFINGKKQDEFEANFQGSEFSLKDVNGKVITQSSFEGPLTAIFFGFTNCPDICPMTLDNLDLVISKLSEKKKQNFKVFCKYRSRKR